MNVKELIEALQNENPEATVLTVDAGVEVGTLEADIEYTNVVPSGERPVVWLSE